jgi:cysteinyl-tRNA synthetase
MTAPQSFRIYNTLTRELEDFQPIHPGQIGLYVCGMTVYDDAHVGHARAMVVFDAFVRSLRARGWGVTFVRNFTDVDDKIIRRALQEGQDPMDIAQRYIDAFHRDTDALGLARPDHEPRVSTSMPDIIALTQELIDRGHAYVADHNVWFAVQTFPDYGKLSGQRLDELRSADEDSGKRHPADFALWKASKPAEPAWESPWGPGRPGWHIECSAMAHALLGETFDIHAGGLDLIFPHHENEIAQSECGHGAHYVNYWMHNGLLVIDDGQKMKGGVADPNAAPTKMGKSLGNVFNIHNALDAFPPEVLRFYYLNAHYRSPLPWGDQSLPTALQQLMRLYEARERAELLEGDGDPDAIARELGEAASDVLQQGRDFIGRFDEAIAQDFNTPRALSYLFELSRAINRLAEHKKARKRGGPVVAPALAAFAHAHAQLGILRG